MPASGPFTTIANTQKNIDREQKIIEEQKHAEIADSIIVFFTDSSVSSIEKIQNAVQEAGKKYNGDDYSWVMSSILTYWHGRKNEVKSTEKDILEYSDILTRLQTLSKVFLNPKGGWKSTSYNTLLLVHFMRAIDGVLDDRNDQNYFEIIEKIIEPFKEKLQGCLHDCQFSQIKAKEENLAIQSIKSQQVDFVTIFSQNSGMACEHAKENPDEVVFCLQQKDSGWNLVWFDLYGEKIKLELSDELKALLDNKTQDDPEVKYECLKLKDLLIEERSVKINPPASELADLKSTFVLKGSGQDYSLDWYDANGHCKAIQLADYSSLTSFLHAQDNSASINVEQLERHLRQVNVKEKVGIISQIKKLDNFFKQKSAEAAPTFNVLVNPQSHQLSGLESTFVLYTNNNQLRLEWYDALAVAREMDISMHESFCHWIASQKEPIEANNFQLKEFLVDVDTSKQMDRSEFKAQLKELLEQRQAHGNTKSEVEPSSKSEVSGKLDLSKYHKIAGLFGHKEAHDAASSQIEPSSTVTP